MKVNRNVQNLQKNNNTKLKTGEGIKNLNKQKYPPSL